MAPRAATRSAVTRAALDDAAARAEDADARRARPPRRRSTTAQRRARRAVASTKPTPPKPSGARSHELDGVERARARVDAERTQRDVEVAAIARRAGARCTRSAPRDVEGIAALEVRVPALEADAAEAQSLFESRALVQLELDERATTVASQRRDSTCAPRSSPSGARCSSTGSPRSRTGSRATRSDAPRPSSTGSRSSSAAPATPTVGSRLGELTARIDELLERLAHRPAGRGRARGGRQRPAPGAPHARAAEAEQELVELRELLQRREVEEAETRLRLETAVERLRTEYDVEPAVALDAPAPEVPDGTTLAGRARELDRELRLMGPINPLALEEYDALLERHEFLQAQLDDVKASRRELNRVIKAVDQEIVDGLRAARSPTCSRELHRPVRHAVPRRVGQARCSPIPTTC